MLTKEIRKATKEINRINTFYFLFNQLLSLIKATLFSVLIMLVWLHFHPVAITEILYLGATAFIASILTERIPRRKKIKTQSLLLQLDITNPNSSHTDHKDKLHDRIYAIKKDIKKKESRQLLSYASSLFYLALIVTVTSFSSSV